MLRRYFALPPAAAMVAGIPRSDRNEKASGGLIIHYLRNGLLFEIVGPKMAMIFAVDGR